MLSHLSYILDEAWVQQIFIQRQQQHQLVTTSITQSKYIQKIHSKELNYLVQAIFHSTAEPDAASNNLVIYQLHDPKCVHLGSKSTFESPSFSHGCWQKNTWPGY
jgi:hypothetical protein